MIHSTAQRKEHSKTEFRKKNPEIEFGESETFYRSKFSRATGVRWGWVFLERTRILSEIQFTTHFIEIFVMQTKQFVRSFINVIFVRVRP